MTPITHIVPCFPPQIGCLGNYCRLLADRLFELHEVSASLFLGDPLLRYKKLSNDISALSRRDAIELLEKLGSAKIVILHYICSGYHHRGLPFKINHTSAF